MVVYYYRIWCDTENQYVYIWDTREPTTCPNNNSHSIDATKTAIIESVSNDPTNVRMVDVDTLDPSLAVTCEEGFVIDVPAGVTSVSHSFSYPFKIDILGAECYANWSGVDRLDKYRVVIIPATDPDVGAVIANANVNDTVLTVESNAMANVGLNYFIKLGADENEYRVVGKGTNTLTLASGLQQSLTAPVGIKIRIPFVIDRYIYPNEFNTIGEWTEGGKSIPANYMVRTTVFFNTATTSAFKIPYTVFYKYQP